MYSNRLVSVLGLFILVLFAWLLSTNRKKFPLRTVVSGITLQFVFALFILKTDTGKKLFGGAQDVVNQLNIYGSEGAKMIFGPLANKELLEKTFGPENAFIFAVPVMAAIVLISALSALFYHWGILQRIVQGMAWVMMKTMRTSGSESLAAASNIFVGQTEAALLIRPYIPQMTKSELAALMVAGFATIATGVMIVYSGLKGMNAGDIITASVMSAPAALVMSKIMFPETEKSETGEGSKFAVEKVAVNSVDALCRGASEGIALTINVLAMLVAFVALVALSNALFAWLQTKCGVTMPVSFQQILGIINAPFAWVIGVPWKDCQVVGQILGERIVLNEFVGYLTLSGKIAADPTALDERSVRLATYALCGFANFSSIAIQIGGIGALAPERRGDLAKLGFKAMVAGLLACYLTATVVGVLI